jgi:large subunit ribosomal protein L18|tara:strand:+ start:147 stop:659 length:513 start_codon:yes stop_codon:yes gene_type:complete
MKVLRNYKDTMRLRTMRRRRNEGKTDYKLRKGLLSSKIPRIVVRRTNKYFICQVVESNEAQDKVVTGVTSRDLIKLGWDVKLNGSLKSIPVGYLTGLLLAKKIGKGKFIMDLGMTRTITGSRVFSVVKGLIDGGLKIPANNKAFPNEERISGEHLKPEVKKMIAKVRGKI